MAKAGERLPDNAIYSTVLEKMLFVMIVIGVVFILFLIEKLSGNIVKPLLQLNDAAMELANGNLDVSIDIHTEDEVGELGNSIEKTVKRLKEYIDDMSQVVQDNSAMAEETSATSEKLAAQSVTLNELVQKFELN